jgi:hypothetical protein
MPVYQTFALKSDVTIVFAYTICHYGKCCLMYFIYSRCYVGSFCSLIQTIGNFVYKYLIKMSRQV